MRVIALLPVKNEAWVLEHTLACLSSFCDVVLVNDQRSEDGSRKIGKRFPKVVWIDSPESQSPRECSNGPVKIGVVSRHCIALPRILCSSSAFSAQGVIR